MRETVRLAAAPCLAAALAALLFLAGSPAAGQQERGDYELSPRETVSIKVGTWDPVAGLYVDLPALGGEYRIGPMGRLSMPMAGEIDTTGMTPAELAVAIRDKLTRAMGVDGQVEAAVTVADFAPIYVLGAVEAPGAYDYAPGLSVVQGISLAGGLRRGSTAFLRTERSALASLGDYRVMELELLRHLATEARLQAELDGADEVPVPARVAAAPMGEEFMAREREIFDARQASFRTAQRQLSDLDALLQERIASIDKQLVLRGQQLDLLRDELAKASQLVERGLSVESTRSSLQRLLVDQEVRQLELETAKLNAEQRLSEVDRDRSNLINDRRRFLVENIRSERAEIAKLEVRMETEAALYSEALQYGDGFISQDVGAAPIYTVTRHTNGETRTLTVERGDRMRPGDVLEVTLPGPGQGDLAGSQAPLDAPLVDPTGQGGQEELEPLRSALPASEEAGAVLR